MKSKMNVATGEMIDQIKVTVMKGIITNMYQTGIKCKVLKCEVKNLEENTLAYHAASKRYRAKLTLDEHGNVAMHKVLVKTMLQSAIMREITNSQLQFDDEYVVYHDVIPLLVKKATNHSEERLVEWWRPQELFPRCYYLSNGDHEHAMIVLEDLSIKGYRIRGDPVNLAMEYNDILTAIKALGRFHALSYNLKLREPEYFLENVTSKVRNTRPVVTDLDKQVWTHYLDYLHLSSLLVCSRLEEESKEVKYASGIQKLTIIMSDPTVLHRLMLPTEPLAVFCHGDYVMNNMLFKDEQLKVVDFQTAMYSSPCMDLATILFMHSGDFIDRWNELLREYHSSLIRCLGHQRKELSMEAFHDEFVRCGFFGCIISVAFLISVGENPNKTTFEHEAVEVPKDPKERRKHLQNTMKLENEDTARRVVALLRETLDRVSTVPYKISPQKKEIKMDVATRKMMDRIKEALMKGNISQMGFNCKVIKCEVENLDQNVLAYHAASKIYRAKLTLEEHGNVTIHNVLVKTMPHTALMREIMSSELQFDDEYIVYHDVIPLLVKKATNNSEEKRFKWWRPQELFPRCYYSSSGDHEHAMIVLEDLSGKGYRIRGDPVSLSMEYHDVLIAIKTLGRFHALSYNLKFNEPEYFLENVASQVRNTRPVVTDPNAQEWTHYLDYLHLSALLVCSRLEKEDKEGKYTSGIQKLRMILNDPTVLHSLMMPVEPLAVFCHGDYVMNNMLFKEDEVKLLDFQHSMYSSPVVDLATILFMHGAEFINRWNELLGEYHSYLIRCLGHQPKELSIDAFLDEFVRCGLFGFIISAAFLISVGENPNKTSFEDGVVDVPKDPKERRKHMQNTMKVENEDTARRVVALLRETLDRGIV